MEAGREHGRAKEIEIETEIELAGGRGGGVNTSCR